MLLPITGIPSVLAGLHTSGININSPIVSHWLHITAILKTHLRTSHCPLILVCLFMYAVVLEKSFLLLTLFFIEVIWS